MKPQFATIQSQNTMIPMVSHAYSTDGWMRFDTDGIALRYKRWLRPPQQPEEKPQLLPLQSLKKNKIMKPQFATLQLQNTMIPTGVHVYSTGG